MERVGFYAAFKQRQTQRDDERADQHKRDAHGDIFFDDGFPQLPSQRLNFSVTTCLDAFAFALPTGSNARPRNRRSGAVWGEVFTARARAQNRTPAH